MDNSEIDDATFSDDEDREAFGNDPISHKLYLEQLKHLKHNPDPLIPFSVFDRGNGYHTLSTLAWKRVGLFAGRSLYTRVINVSECDMSEESFTALVTGLQQSQSLEYLILDKNPSIGGASGMTALCSYLACENCNLTSLGLEQCGLSFESLEILASTMSQTKIEMLSLNNNYLGTQMIRERISALLQNLITSNLRKLSMHRCNIGMEWCTGFANSLRDETSQLKLLSLNDNRLDDDCISFLATSLRYNTSLCRLNVRGNSSITAAGMEHFYRLLCDSTTIQSTYDSNHTLTKISAGSCDESPVGNLISRMTRLNQNKDLGLAQVARVKVALTHFSHCDEAKEGFDMRPLLELNVKLIPHVLAWFGRKDFIRLTYSDVDRFRSIFRIIRHWNVRVLFGSPSSSNREDSEPAVER